MWSSDHVSKVEDEAGVGVGNRRCVGTTTPWRGGDGGAGAPRWGGGCGRCSLARQWRRLSGQWWRMATSSSIHATSDAQGMKALSMARDSMAVAVEVADLAKSGGLGGAEKMATRRTSLAANAKERTTLVATNSPENGVAEASNKIIEQEGIERYES